MSLISLPSRGSIAAAVALACTLASASAFAVQSAELYRTDAFFYGRFEARVQFAPGEGVVSSFFLWKDGSSSTTSWNELDYEKVKTACQLQTNIWSGTGTQSPQIPSITADLCGGYHTYSFEWTPDYIAWFIDGTQLRRETGSVVAEYTQNAAQGMAMHFNVWVGNSSVRRGPRPCDPAGERIHRLGRSTPRTRTGHSSSSGEKTSTLRPSPPDGRSGTGHLRTISRRTTLPT